MEGVHRAILDGHGSVTAEITITRWRDLGKWAPLVGLGTEAPWPLVELRSIVSQVTPEAYDPEPDETVRFAGVRWYGEGLFVREERDGSLVKGKCYPLLPGLLVYNRLFAWKQSFAVVTPEFEGVVVSNEFPQFEVDEELARTEFVALVCASAKFAEVALMSSTGSTAVSRNRLHEVDFLDLEIPLPPLPEQTRIIARHKTDKGAEAVAAKAAEARSSVAWEAFADVLIEPPAEEIRAGGLVSVARFADLSRWDKPGGETGLIFQASGEAARRDRGRAARRAGAQGQHRPAGQGRHAVPRVAQHPARPCGADRHPRDGRAPVRCRGARAARRRPAVRRGFRVACRGGPVRDVARRV